MAGKKRERLQSLIFIRTQTSACILKCGGRGVGSCRITATPVSLLYCRRGVTRGTPPFLLSLSPQVLPLQLPSLDVDVRRVPLPPAAQVGGAQRRGGMGLEVTCAAAADLAGGLGRGGAGVTKTLRHAKWGWGGVQGVGMGF